MTTKSLGTMYPGQLAIPESDMLLQRYSCLKFSTTGKSKRDGSCGSTADAHLLKPDVAHTRWHSAVAVCLACKLYNTYIIIT